MKTVVSKKNTQRKLDPELSFWARIALEQQAIIHAKNGS